MVTETRSLHRKLAQIMYEAERIPKRGKAPSAMGGFPFVQVGDAADFIRKALAEKVISMVPTRIAITGQTEHQTKSGGSMTTVDMIVDWTLTDGESGESIVIQSFGAGADGGDKYSGKAQTNAMKYALLMGFLLSTGDDPELSDSSDRRPRQVQREVGDYDEPPARPELERMANNLIGTAEIGKARDSDFELRKSGDDEHFALGFKLKSNGGGFKVLTRDELALQLLDVKDEVVGKRVTVFGRVRDEEYTPKGTGRKVVYQVIDAERIKTEAGTLPVMPRREEADTNTSGSHQDWDGTEPAPLRDPEQDVIPVAEGQEPLFDQAESDRLDREAAAAG